MRNVPLLHTQEPKSAFPAWGDCLPTNTAAGTAVNASGGDPMDLSWAVDEYGEPVYLDNIRFVRIYTGIAKNNGIFGEISTEFCGAGKATPVTAGIDKTGYPSSITPTAGNIGSYTSLKYNVMRKATLTVSGTATTINVTSTAENVFINGTARTSIDLTSNNGTTQYVQIINQDGNKHASITVLKVIFQ